jgi:hypothetical protein
VVVCAVACLGAVASGVAAASTPVDGLVLRLDLTTGPWNGTMLIRDCSPLDVVGRARGHASGVTVSPSAAGWRDDTVASGAQGSVLLADVSGALVFAAQDWWVRDPAGHRFLLHMRTPVSTDPGCHTVPSTGSASGEVVQGSWEAYPCDTRDTNGNCLGPVAYSGAGCTALWRAGTRLVATVSFGACDAGAWPAISPTPAPTQTSIFVDASAQSVAVTRDGAAVKRLRRGTYRFLVGGSGRDNVHLRGPGIDKASPPGKPTAWVVTLRRGTYRLFSDRNPKRAQASIVVP